MYINKCKCGTSFNHTLTVVCYVGHTYYTCGDHRTHNYTSEEIWTITHLMFDDRRYVRCG